MSVTLGIDLACRESGVDNLLEGFRAGSGQMVLRDADEILRPLVHLGEILEIALELALDL